MSGSIRMEYGSLIQGCLSGLIGQCFFVLSSLVQIDVVVFSIRVEFHSFSSVTMVVPWFWSVVICLYLI